MENLSIISRNPSVVYIGTDNIDVDRIDGEFYNYKYLKNEKGLKKAGVKIKVLDDVIERMNSPIGWQGIPSTSYLQHGLGVPLIRVQNVSDLILDEESLIGVEESIYDEQPAIQAQANDIIITRVGTIGRVCRIPENINKIAMGQNLTRIKLKETIIESGFMLAYMSSKFCQIQMERYAYGGVQASLTNKNIKQLLVPIPSPEIQEYIGNKIRKAEEFREEAKRLSNLCEEKLKIIFDIKEDELLFNNNAGNMSLEYSNYPIINFLKANNINDRIDPKAYHPELYNTLKKLGTKTVKLKELLCNYATGKSSPEYWENGTPILMTKNIRNSYIDWNCRYVSNRSINSDDLVKKEDVLITTYGGPSIGKVDIKFEENEATFDYTIMKVRFEKICNPYFMTLLLRSKYIQNQLRYIIKGTTGITFVIPNEILNILIPIVDIGIQNEIGSLFERCLGFVRMSEQLIQEAKQDVEDLIEGNFDIKKIR